MTHARLAQAAEAKTWLDRGSRWVERAEADKRGTTWEERLQLGLLRREAEEQVKSAGKGK